MKNDGPADSETNDCPKCGDDHQVRAQLQVIGKNGREGEQQSKHIKPQRGVDGRTQIFAQTELHEQCGEPDGGDNDESQRTGKRRATGVDDDESESQHEQARGKNTPAARLRRDGRVGIVLGQRSSLKLYSGESDVSIRKTILKKNVKYSESTRLDAGFRY